MPGDAVKVASKNYKTLVENERVRVLEYRGKVGEKTAMHSHPAVVAVPLTAGKFKFTLENGQSFELDLKAGVPVFVEAQSHSTEYLGPGPGEARALLIELK